MTDKNLLIEKTLRQLIIKTTKNDKIVITPTCTFKDLGVDSMEVVQILVALEDKLSIDIDDKDLKRIHDMGSFIEYLSRKVPDKHTGKN